MAVDEFHDIGFQVFEGSMGVVLELFAGEFGEVALDLIDVRRGSWGEVKMIMRSRWQIRTELIGLVGGVVIHGDMDIVMVG